MGNQVESALHAKSYLMSSRAGLSNTARESKRFHLSISTEQDGAQIIKDRRQDSPESPLFPHHAH
ncbi:hypothetical protein G5I_14593 [Acromyrmex echinatior]|uniref:Uncharacterized protein n=1 Tax=Acromyrmex echinatior TaxID=103372 RepID=F4X854_ACREC|nr:hypothetical protein G5I_14593 [Acromyrmex echinatior]